MSHYCLNCGKELQQKHLDGRIRDYCPACGWINYEQRKVSAGVRIEQENRLLLVQRGIEPWYGKWYMPAGFVEVDEEPENAAIREAMEETGLTVKLDGLAGVYTYDDDPRGNGIVLMYDAEILGGTLQSTPETLQAGFFDANEIKGMPLAGACVEKQVGDWLKLNGHAKGYSHD